MGWLKIDFNCEGFSFENLGGFAERNDNLMQLFEMAYTRGRNRCDLDKTRIAVWSGDRPHTVDVFDGYQHLCLSNTREKADQCFPCFSFMSWKTAAISDFEDVVKEIRERSLSPPLYNKLFWIGNLKTHFFRRKYYIKARQYPDILECVPMKWVGPGEAQPYVSLSDHTKWSMLLDIEGTGYSGRLKFLAHAGRPLFVQDREYWDWAGAKLEPVAHYIPVDRQFTTIDNLVREAHNTEQMVLQCQTFAEKNFTRDRAIEHIIDLLF